MRKTKSMITLLLCLTISLQLVSPYIGTVSAAAVQDGAVHLGDVVVAADTETRAAGNGTFEIDLSLMLKRSGTVCNTENTASAVGYYTVPKTGTYLLEVWGGNGGDGAASGFSEGGKGGAGGYLYGTIRLSVGQTLLMTAGGSGSASGSKDCGGGANGGGGHGESGSYLIGGGGGYSAAYLFNPGEFEEKYLDSEGKIIRNAPTEADRTGRYLMIAGGGGGGGAGNSYSHYPCTGSPDGGDGGSMSSPSGFTANGVFYAGSDGRSSGISSLYIGVGGTDRPGAVPEGLIQMFEGQAPSSWSQPANSHSIGGSGGSSNYRGGAGGAGFCGGSGGIMNSMMLAANVGGGGGGSSFLSETIQTDLDARTRELLKGENPSASGGAVSVTLVPDSADAEVLSLTGTASKYFHVSSTDCAFSVDAQGNFTVNDLFTGETEECREITLRFTPKQGFAGGNRVPLLENETSLRIHSSAGAAALLPLADQWVNVPLNFSVHGNSFMTDTPGTEFPVDTLYEDFYAEVRQNPGHYWQYDFIEAITPFLVKDSSGTTVLQESVSPAETTRYCVSFTVIPKSGTAAVGNPVLMTTYSDTAKIAVTGVHNADLNKVHMDYAKTLRYEKGNFILSLRVKSEIRTPMGVLPPPFTLTPDNPTFEVQDAGLYLIEATGGHGGKGANGGGIGGTGGSVSGMVVLQAGDVISAVLGQKGADGTGTAGGGGGTETRVFLNGIPVMVAGGGGGGGGGSLAASGEPGRTRVTTIRGTDVPDISQDGKPGKKSPDGIWSPGDGGDAGINYTSLEEGPPDSDSSLTPGKGGQTVITCLESEGIEGSKAANQEKLENYNLTFEISDYFSVLQDEILCSGCTAELSEPFCVSHIMPRISHREENAVLTSRADFTVSIPFRPAEGFIGGNDVPLLTSMVLSSLNTGPAGQADVLVIASRDETDYVNVPLTFTPVLKGRDAVYLAGQPGVSASSLFVWENRPDTSASPQWDFAEAVLPSETVLRPSATCRYTNTVLIRPKAEARKAVITDSSQPLTAVVTSTIFVRYPVVTQLENLEKASGKETAAWGENYSCAIVPAEGYLLPDTVTVTVGGKEIQNFTYEKGNLMIPGTEVTGPISISARAQIETYTLHYYYELRPGFGQGTHTEQYEAGASIPADSFGLTYIPPEAEGWHFSWDWATAEDSPLVQMPAKDWFVTGRYLPNPYTLTIRCFKGDTLAETLTKEVLFGEDYQVVLPIYAGYLSENPIVSGTMAAGDLCVDVYYTPTVNQLNILYILQDTQQEYARYTESLDTDEPFSVISPEISGYTPDIKKAEGIMKPEGVTVYVSYSPNTYTVTFDPDGGSCSQNSFDVIYHNRYGFDGVSYRSFPKPVKTGFGFAGWYLGDQKITQESVVETAEAHTLVAGWNRQKYGIFIRYLYEDGSEAGHYAEQLPFGQDYSIATPELPGFRPDRMLVEGVTGAQDITVTVTYHPLPYMLRILYLFEDGTQACEPWTGEILCGSVYEIHAPELPGFRPSVQTVSGRMPASEREITVYYYSEDPVIQTTISWGNMEFDYTRGNWNPELHSYGADSIHPTEENSNRITITNSADSAVSVDAYFVYASAIPGLQGYFADSPQSAPIYDRKGLPPGATQNIYLWLKGSVPESKEGSLSAGICKITISGGGKNGI